MTPSISPLTGIQFGTDPEGFFAYTADGRIAGAEKVLPANGIGPSASARVVLDGVQFEMHPGPSAVVYDVGRSLHECFSAIATQLKTKEGQFTVDFTQVVTVDEPELLSLSEAARKLGCMPSFNFYRKRPIKVSENFPVRSAAGHLHLGLAGTTLFDSYNRVDYRLNLIPLLDLFVGIPTVLMDRDPLARTRRRLYGHAGEYRLPIHGLEYRTLSNFWLKDFALFELVCGLAYTACCVLGTSVHAGNTVGAFDPERELAKQISLRQLEGAIERNSATMAWKLWEVLRQFIATHVPASTSFPVHAGNIHQVNHFFKACAQGKLASFVNPDPVDHWLNLCDTAPKSAASTWGCSPAHKFVKPAVMWPQFLGRVSPVFPPKTPKREKTI